MGLKHRQVMDKPKKNPFITELNPRVAEVWKDIPQSTIETSL